MRSAAIFLFAHGTLAHNDLEALRIAEHADIPMRGDLRGLPGPPSDVPPMTCDYKVNQQPATLLSGSIPDWVNGSYYHAMFGTNLKADIPIPGISGTNDQNGAVLAAHFRPGKNTTASFGFVRGSFYHDACPLRKSVTKGFGGSGAVTVNSMGGPGTITSVTAMPEVTVMDGLSLETIESPIKLNGSLGKAQNSFLGLGPEFFAPAHMATDSNGDVYGLVYVYEPTAGYRFYRVRSGTRQREVFPDFPAHAMFGGKTMAYAHQAVAFTENYVLFPEIPCGMCPKGKFNFDVISDGWIQDAEIVVTVFDKKTMVKVASYSAPGFFTWHNINAWETETSISFDFSWQPNATAALNPFTTGLLPYGWQGRLARATMPNPAAPGAAKSGAMTIRYLTPFPTIMSPEFAVVNPVYMWREPCRYMWAAATTDNVSDRKLTYWPEIIRVDTHMADGAVLKYRAADGWAVSSPTFVPKSDTQSADSSEGVLIVLLLDQKGNNKMALLDAETLKEVAVMHLPVAPMVGGLHNHFDRYPASA